MSRRTSKRLVIDADVLRASGDAGATDPRARRCREFLLAVKQICHHAHLTDSLRDEWRRHASKFGRTWWVEMSRRGKILRNSDAEDPEVRSRVPRAGLCDADFAALEKDLHLLEAALRADDIVVTAEAELPRIVEGCKTIVRKLKRIRFVPPDPDALASL